MEKIIGDFASLQTRALARWENEGGAMPIELAEAKKLEGLREIERADVPVTPEDRAGQIREAVAVFDTVEQLQGAIDELLESGFDRAELSLLAAADSVDGKVGRLPISEFEDDPKTPRGIYVSPEALGAAEGGIIGALAYVGGIATAAVIALSGGPITAMIIGGALVGGAGGLVGTGLAAILGFHRAAYFDEQLARGGLLLWVRTWSSEREERALTILRRFCGHDTHVHAFSTSGQPDVGQDRERLP